MINHGSNMTFQFFSDRAQNFRNKFSIVSPAIGQKSSIIGILQNMF